MKTRVECFFKILGAASFVFERETFRLGRTSGSPPTVDPLKELIPNKRDPTLDHSCVGYRSLALVKVIIRHFFPFAFGRRLRPIETGLVSI